MGVFGKEFQSGHPVQVYAPDGTSNKIDLTGSSQSVALPGTELVEISATQNCWIAFGGSGVTAAKPGAGAQTGISLLFIQGTAAYIVPKGTTHVAGILDGTTAGALCVTSIGVNTYASN